MYIIYIIYIAERDRNRHREREIERKEREAHRMQTWIYIVTPKMIFLEVSLEDFSNILQGETKGGRMKNNC